MLTYGLTTTQLDILMVMTIIRIKISNHYIGGERTDPANDIYKTVSLQDIFKTVHSSITCTLEKEKGAEFAGLETSAKEEVIFMGTISNELSDLLDTVSQSSWKEDVLLISAERLRKYGLKTRKNWYNVRIFTRGFEKVKEGIVVIPKEEIEKMFTEVLIDNMPESQRKDIKLEVNDERTLQEVLKPYNEIATLLKSRYPRIIRHSAKTRNLSDIILGLTIRDNGIKANFLSTFYPLNSSIWTYHIDTKEGKDKFISVSPKLAILTDNWPDEILKEADIELNNSVKEWIKEKGFGGIKSKVEGLYDGNYYRLNKGAGRKRVLGMIETQNNEKIMLYVKNKIAMLPASSRDKYYIKQLHKNTRK